VDFLVTIWDDGFDADLEESCYGFMIAFVSGIGRGKLLMTWSGEEQYLKFFTCRLLRHRIRSVQEGVLFFSLHVRVRREVPGVEYCCANIIFVRRGEINRSLILAGS
jgi:hypothetical protein